MGDRDGGKDAIGDEAQSCRSAPSPSATAEAGAAVPEPMCLGAASANAGPNALDAPSENISRMSDPAGSLDIHLRRSASGLVCAIGSTRPIGAASAFIGLSPAEAAERLPLLYAICARAQAGACACALEQAQGVVPSATTRIRRQAAIAAETIREHLWRILLDWPALLGETPDRSGMAAVLGLSNRVLGLLDPAGDLFEPGAESAAASPQLGALVADLTELLTRRIYGASPESWLSEVAEASAFERWCRVSDTRAARLLRSLLDSGEASLGQTPVAPLPGMPDEELISCLSGSAAADFIARPTWRGHPCETSPFTRRLAMPLIASLVERHGPGLLPRLAAQLVEVAVRLRRLTPDPAGPDPDPPARPAGAAGLGLGRAPAARGQLVHLVRVDGGRVRDYRILAPTEWNFHPRGLVAQGLVALSGSSDTALRRQAELLITAIDPCVAFALTLS